MMTLLISALLQTAAQTSAPATPNAPTIVVTARSTRNTGAALADCLARKCPPKEDIAASLAHAENQFLDGDYPSARTTLLASRNRNRGYAKTLPVEVSNLSRANARLASLNGQADQARTGTIDTLDALKAGLPDSDPRVLMQRLEVGDVFAQQGRVEGARQIYDGVASQARKLHLPMVEGNALFRSAVMFGAIASVVPRYRPDAKMAAERITKTTDPALAPFRDGVTLLRARLDTADGKTDAIDKAVAQFRGRPSSDIRLLYAPAIDYQLPAKSGSTVVTPNGDVAAQWVDISFWIGPDGTTHDVEVLRKSPNFVGTWLTPVTKAIAGRRYAPLALDASDPGVVRVERYSLVSNVEAQTGSRIAERSSNRRIEMLDLTAPTPPARPATPGRQGG